MGEAKRPDFPTLLDDALNVERQLEVLAKDAVAACRRERDRAGELQQALDTLEEAYLETIRSLAFVVEAKDAYTGQHLERCRVYGVALMKELGVHEEYPDAQYGFLLHDAGKVGVPERILGKPGPLTAAEWRVVRAPPPLRDHMGASIPLPHKSGGVGRCHPPQGDGRGRPGRLKG